MKIFATGLAGVVAGKELSAGAKLLKQFPVSPCPNDSIGQSFVMIRGPRIQTD